MSRTKNRPNNIDAPGAGDYIAANIAELQCSPLLGAFDELHLKRVHESIFQGFTESQDGIPFHPGKFRTEIASKEGDWRKIRGLETSSATLFIVYSHMGKADIDHLHKTLAKANPAKLAKLSTKEFVAAIGDIYANLDYVHPFEEGNSRTLREFTRQLAKESGYELDWERFSRSPGGRDTLYVARDLSVNKIALSMGIRKPGNERDVLATIDIFQRNRDLQSLLHDVVRPLESSLKKSLDELKKDLPAGSVVKEANEKANSTYRGKIVKASLHHVLQEVGAKTYVVHERSRIGQDVQVGKTSISLSYKDGKAQVVPARGQEPQRGKGLQR